jgi:hypothetical protein
MALALMTIIVIVIIGALSRPAGAGPVPPCSAAPLPDFGAVDAAPHAQVWTAAELGGWQPDPCLRWQRADVRLVAVLASRFRTGGDAFARLGDVAAWSRLRYWSISHQTWRPLALAVSLADESQPVTAWPAGKSGLFSERDENTGEADYRLTVLERTPDRIVLASENASAIKLALFTAFGPGALQTVTFLHRERPEVWTSWQITRVGSASSSLALSHAGSFLNRLEAVRRHLAGVPSDKAAPVAPH